MIVLIDNYDSFSYNLVHLMGDVGQEEIKIIRNDALTVDEVIALKPSGLILSPGPKRPEDAGICLDLIKKAEGHIPMLGVCLGHQCICMAYGAHIIHAKELVHGKQSMIQIKNDSRLFMGMQEEIPAARYHSLVADKKRVPYSLSIIAKTKDDEIMAIEHKEYPIYGVQFHPESILTPSGKKIIENFSTICNQSKQIKKETIQ